MVNAGPPSMMRGGGGGATTGDRGLTWTGLILETWKVGWTLMDRGRASLTAVGLTILCMEKGPTNLGASFLLSTLTGRSLVDNQTF